MRASNTPFVSVVTPVFNGEKYIDDCIQSVRRQTYQAWEYVIVDNCSTDGTSDIVQKHVAEESRIRVLRTPELLPLIQNHNFALEQISPKSQYCKIVHADDKLFPECLELMVAAGDKHPSASIVGSYSLWGEKVVSDGIPLETTLITGRDLCRKTLLGQIYCFWSPSALLIRSSSIRERGSFYKGTHLHADVEAYYELLRNSDFAFAHQILSFIRRHDESATSRITRPQNRTLVSNLDLFLKFGREFLTKEEYQSELRVKTRQYYRFLVGSLLACRERGFWQFHQEACKAMGFPFRWSQLAQVFLWEALSKPGPTVRNAMAGLSDLVSRSNRNNLV